MVLVYSYPWEKSRDEADLRHAVAFATKHHGLGGESLPYLLLKAVEAFAIHHDVRTASRFIAQCNKARYLREPTWRYSAAFLSAYQGHLNDAIDHYDAAFRLEGNHETPFQIEGFIAWVLEVKPMHKELNFCLGYSNEVFKRDMDLAERYYAAYRATALPTPIAGRALDHAMRFLRTREELASASSERLDRP